MKIGDLVARQRVERRSFAIPAARPPMQFAVAGAMRIWSAHRESSI